MSLAYLQTLLPVTDELPESEDPLPPVSDHELGVLTARYEQFAGTLAPFHERLAPIEAFLESFNAEICSLSETLYSLQEKLAQLNTGLDHQRDLVDKLNPIILDLMIPPSVADSVVKEPITEKWVENTRFIVEKQQLIARIRADALTSHYSNLKAFLQLESGITALEAKAVERIRDHVIMQIRHMRRSLKALSQKIQESLLQIKEVYGFLYERHAKLADQLLLAYIYTMKWYYTTRFAKYLYALQKLRTKHVDLLYVIGSAESGDAKGLFGLVDATYSPQAQSRASVAEYFLSAAKRMEILEDGDPRRSMPSQIAETTPFAYWVEFPFCQWNNAVVDNVVVEYLFVVDFFYQGSEKFEPVGSLDAAATSLPHATKDWCHVMFDDVYKMGQAYVTWLVQQRLQRMTTNATSYPHPTCDAYGVLLMIRLVQNLMYALHNEFRVPAMDEHHNALLLLLWPHFTRIIDTNCDAMKKHMVLSVYSRSSELTQAPISATQKFAQFVTGLLRLAFVHGPGTDKLAQFAGEPVGMSVVRLRNDFESALTKLSTHVFGSSKSRAVQKEIFLFNNYFLVVTILRNEFDESADDFIKEQIHHFELLCDAYKPK